MHPAAAARACCGTRQPSTPVISKLFLLYVKLKIKKPTRADNTYPAPPTV
jgi:hypothetical protein